MPKAESQHFLGRDLADSSDIPVPGISFALYSWLRNLQAAESPEVYHEIILPTSSLSWFLFTSLPADSFIFFHTS